MEASGTPTPAAEPPPPPPSDAPGQNEQAADSSGALGVLLALALGFASFVVIRQMIGLTADPVCAEVQPGPTPVECFNMSATQKTISLVLGWPSGVIGAIAALTALFFAFTGRKGGLMMRLTGAAIVLGALSILIGSV